MKHYRILISGGGTGGHIFPAISIANEVRRRFPNAEILFVGAENHMEMEYVPAAGYKIIGLPVSGYDRRSLLKNANVAIRLLRSLFKARKTIRRFRPDIAVGVGGYASGPTLWMASMLNIPILIQEQNSYPGMTNKLLSKRASTICVAYRGMEKFFPEERIVLTGNPVRKELETSHINRDEAFACFGLQADKPTLLVVGGSLGARTINRGVLNGIQAIREAGIQVIWQTGRLYYDSIRQALGENNGVGLWVDAFISRMDYAYAAADMVVSRAGAGTISELCVLKKAVVLAPSPNVTDDHQTKNARALSDHQAAVLLPDIMVEEQLATLAISILNDREQLQSLRDNIALFAQYNSAERIVDEIVNVINHT